MLLSSGAMMTSNVVCTMDGQTETDIPENDLAATSSSDFDAEVTTLSSRLLSLLPHLVNHPRSDLSPSLHQRRVNIPFQRPRDLALDMLSEDPFRADFLTVCISNVASLPSIQSPGRSVALRVLGTQDTTLLLAHKT